MRSRLVLRARRGSATAVLSFRCGSASFRPRGLRSGRARARNIGFVWARGSAVRRWRCLHRRVPGRHHSRSVKHCGLGSCRDRRTSVVHGREQRAVLSRGVLVLYLRAGRGHVPLAHCGFLGRGRPCGHSSPTAVIADARDIDVVHQRPCVHVMDVCHIHVADSAVVIELPVTPVAAVVSLAGISVAIIDAAVVTHLRTPVSRVPQVAIAAPTPVAGRPQISGDRYEHPCSGHPVIALTAVGPITGGPDVAFRRAGWLCVNRQRRRGKTDSNRNLCA